ncbi:MAG: hypothetical protein JXR07_18230 [Reichenbachiella sp.]
MKYAGIIIASGLLALGVFFTACDPIQEEVSYDGNLQLTFSLDTLKFDTVLSSVGSVTRQFKIRNQNENAIRIERISLGKGTDSEYSIIVNGASGESFENEIIYGNDSILVLVEVFIDPLDQDIPYLVKDSVVMNYNGNSQEIKLVAWGQDANFIDGEVIDCDEIWDSPKPYVIYNYAIVDTLCTLTVEPGTRILIDNGAGLYVKGSLRIEGEAENKVIIRNTRFDAGYNIAPGQWDAIYFLEGSFNSLVDHAEIRNGQIGIRVGNPDLDNLSDLTISNTSIAHMSVSGVRAFTSDLEMINTEVYNCQEELIGLVAGGSYLINHSTFSNYPNSFSRDQSSVIISNFIELQDGSLLNGDLEFSMVNSIVWGDMDEELHIAISEQSNAQISVTNNILKSANSDLELADNLISQESNYPGFYSPLSFNYQIDSLSVARDGTNGSLLGFDLIGTTRDAIPDIGAYERKDSIP